MGMDFNIKPANAPAPVAEAQPVGAAARQAVATLLPAANVVTAAEASARTRRAASDACAGTTHLTVFDRDAATLVHQVVDDRSNLVLRQFPDNALLRRRAYFRAMDLLKDEGSREPAADRTA